MSFFRLNILLVFCLFLGGCSTQQTTPIKLAEEDSPDLSCSYFYFLWGSHAEINKRYKEAHEAYENALICDPSADYVKRKLPLLLLKMGETDKAISWLQQTIKEQQGNIPLYLLLANLYIQKSKPDEATKLYYKVLELDPDNQDVQFRLAFLYTQVGKYGVTETILKKLLKKNNDNYFAHFYLARLLKKLEKYDDAAVEYEKSLSLNWSTELAYEIGYFYGQQKLYTDALRVYDRIIQNDPYDERATLSRVQILLDLDRNEDALTELAHIRLSSQNKPDIDLITAKILLRQKDFKKATKLLLKLAENNENSEPHYLLGLLFYQDKKYEVALQHLGLVSDSSDIFEESVYLQTRIYKKQAKPASAINLLKKYIADSKNSSPLFYALLSSLYQQERKDREAISLLKDAIDIYSDNPQLIFEYGLLLERSGQYQEAMLNMAKVIELQPDHAEALNFIGYTWADNNVNLDSALNYITRAVELRPDNGYIADSLGWVYFQMGELGKAETALEHALKLEPNDPNIYEHLGDVYYSLNKKTKALKTYQKAYEMFEDQNKRTKLQQKIDKISQQIK